jgi:hypothetical protein
MNGCHYWQHFSQKPMERSMWKLGSKKLRGQVSDETARLKTRIQEGTMSFKTPVMSRENSPLTSGNSTSSLKCPTAIDISHSFQAIWDWDAGSILPNLNGKPRNGGAHGNHFVSTLPI